MYIQITTRCNMRCPHCCFSADAKGSDMSFSVFLKVLRIWGGFLAENRKFVVLGGGEPTLHPEFWKFVGYAMAYGTPWVATNGSRTQDSLALCQLARKGVLHAVLSLDEHHDPIDPAVAAAFKQGLRPFACGLKGFDDPEDRREVRFGPRLTKGGRCLEGEEGCACAGFQILPDGKVRACGCEAAPVIGSVDEGITDARFRRGYDPFAGCYKEVITRPARPARPPRARRRAGPAGRRHG
jgi:hypothetical protein